MSHLNHKFSISVATIGLLCATISTASFSADPYTYRSGEVYAKSIATDHTQCEIQCRGDAQCRGWNYVRPNPHTRSGVCEFNARKAHPARSPISISGEIDTGVDALMSHAVPMQGSTVRVGTPIMPNRQVTPSQRQGQRQRQRQGQAQQQPRGQNRIVNRMPVATTRRQAAPAHIQRTIPAQKNIQNARPITPQPTAQQLAYRQRMIEAQRRVAAKMEYLVPRQAMPTQSMSPQRAPLQRMPHQNMAQQPMMPRQMQTQQMVQHPQQSYARPQAPHMQRPVPQAQYPAPQQRPHQAPNPGSLYGSLHDDLTKGMTEVPRPQTAPDQPANPDAPLSTSAAVPTIPVQAAPLSKPAISGLAGG